VKLKDPAGIPAIVILIPVPDVVTLPGVLVRVHVPAAGNPFNVTLPVARAHVVCTVEPIKGAVGVVSIVTGTEAVAGPQPPAAAIVYTIVYVPAVLRPVLIVPVAAFIDRPAGEEE